MITSVIAIPMLTETAMATPASLDPRACVWFGFGVDVGEIVGRDADDVVQIFDGS